DIRSAQAALQKGAITLPELLKDYSHAISQKNPEVNAFIQLELDKAEAKAETVQEKIKNKTAGKLAGTLIGIKDLICQKGIKATCSSNILENFESVYNATVIEKLEAEDAICIGRTNMDEFAMGSSNENTIYGPAKNPHDLTKVCGGSSGGSAAAVAAGFCNAALGSDTGGSIRQPASFCGTVGVKPSYGRVSRYGLIAFASSFDCIGPLTNSVYDAALLLNTLAGEDGRDATSSDQPIGDYTQAVLNPDPQIRIGVPEEYFGEGLDDEIKNRIMDTLGSLEKEGAELVPIKLPHTEYAIAAYYILATAEASSNLARYDGVRYGHRADQKEVREQLQLEEKELTKVISSANGDNLSDLEAQLLALDSPLNRLYKQSRTEGFGTEVKRRIMLGTYVLSAGYYEAYYGKAQRVRRLIKQDFDEAFKSCDVIVSPTAPGTAFDLGSKLDDPLQMYLNDIYTISANLAGICGVSVPAGFHSNGLPVGVQFMANGFEENKLFNASRLVERQFE
ncbi:MAG: amidase family protein, partial [Balneolales bacterium]